MAIETPFGDLLRHHRKAAGLTQEALAEQAGLSVRAISDLERGAPHAPRQVTVDLLAKALRLSEPDRARLQEAARRFRSVVSGVETPLYVVTASTHLSALHRQTPLYGREVELGVLAEHLGHVAPPVLMLAGEPGIGKTRLLMEAVGRARASGLSVLQGGCQRRIVQEPYAPLAGMLARCVEVLGVERAQALEGCAWLVRLMPELASMLGEPARPSTMAPQEERRLVFEAVARFLSRLDESTGLLLVLDDIQWAATDFMDLLLALVHSPLLPRLRVVAAYRDTDVQPGDPLATTLADLAHAGLVQQLALAPLSEPAARSLLASLFPDSTQSDRFADHVIHVTGGVPFFLVRYAQDLQHRESISDLEPGVPWDISHSIRQRVGTLPPLAREVVWTASVVGRTIPYDLLGSVVRQPEPEMVEALEAVCAARLLMEADAHTYQFTHDVIRDVVESSLGAVRRVVLHRRIAEALEGIPNSQPEDLAHHYARSDQPEKALTYLIRAADRSRAAAAPRHEAALLERAVSLALSTGRTEMVADLRARRGRALFTAALWREARQEYRSAIDDLPMDKRVPVLVDLAVLSHWLLDVPATHRYATAALQAAEEMRRDDLAASAQVALALASSSDGDLRTSVDQYRYAYLRNGRRHILLPSAGVELCGLVKYWLGDVDDAVELNRQAIELGRASYDTTSVARAMGNLGLSLMGKGRYAEAEQAFLEARGFAREHSLSTWLARSTSMHAGFHLQLFNFDTAESLAEEAREISRSANWALATISAGIDLLLSFARRGDGGRAEALLSEVAEGVAGGQGAHGWLWRLRFSQAQTEVALLSGAWEAALQWAKTAGGQSRRHGRIKYEILAAEAGARALVGMGRTQEAAGWLSFAVSRARDSGDPLLFLQAASSLLALDGNDALLQEANAVLARIINALPSDATRRQLEASPTIQVVSSLAR